MEKMDDTSLAGTLTIGLHECGALKLGSPRLGNCVRVPKAVQIALIFCLLVHLSTRQTLLFDITSAYSGEKGIGSPTYRV